MTPLEWNAFISGVVLGAAMGLFLGLVLIPAIVDAWVRSVRVVRGHRRTRGVR